MASIYGTIPPPLPPDARLQHKFIRLRQRRVGTGISNTRKTNRIRFENLTICCQLNASSYMVSRRGTRRGCRTPTTAAGSVACDRISWNRMESSRNVMQTSRPGRVKLGQRRSLETAKKKRVAGLSMTPWWRAGDEKKPRESGLIRHCTPPKTALVAAGSRVARPPPATDRVRSSVSAKWKAFRTATEIKPHSSHATDRLE